MPDQAKFITGSTMRHVAVMSSTGATGLLALFLVDLLDMYFISLLGEVELAAAIGFAGTLLFFSTSVSIGLSIAQGALVSRAVGSGEREQAKDVAASVFVYSFIVGMLVASLMLMFVDDILALIGAHGEAAIKAKEYLVIILPSAPVLAVAMSAGAVLRAVGDAKRSMYSTLAGGAVNAVFDPLFIFGLSMGVEGAAAASVLARFAVFAVAFYCLNKHYQFVKMPEIGKVISNVAPVFAIALPALLTNIATPVGNAFVTSHIAKYGDNFVAGYAVIGRITPVAFALIFSLSGAIGPIIGQNFGARQWDRVAMALRDAVIFSTLYCLVISVVLFFLQDALISVFQLSGDASHIFSVFSTYVAFTFVFNGTLFIANAAFNNLNRPTWSTMLNVGKATIGTIPFAYLGGAWGGAIGVLLGQAAGSVLFGIIGYVMLRKELAVMRGCQERKEQEEMVANSPSVPVSPFCSSQPELVAEDAD
ncbi:MATE family efflux transporter [Parasalinivibrio latis]|uniref:MATE family efflux transporter n=1 Tax=Parasalinivibrio latis TaxID=2952610 RepID=UPI0030E3DB9E